MIANSERIIPDAKRALKLCAGILIPSIFPFMAAASLFINYSSEKNYKAFSPLFRFLFGTSSYAVCALIPGMLCGYPIGASCVCELYKKDAVSKSEAESLIAYSNNSGPLFIIGAIGIGMLGSAKYGLMLYVIHISAALICGIILKPFTQIKKDALKININEKQKNFTDCIADSTISILKICGFVVAFAVINSLLSPAIDLLPVYFKCLASAFLELTNASDEITKSIGNEKTMIIFLSGALGWSGMSVHMQVKSIISETDLSLKKYYLIRLLSAIISMMISSLIFNNPSDSSKGCEEIHHCNVFLLASGVIMLFAIISSFYKRHIKKPSH